MKLAALFAKFLYQHRELRLPGIGIFTLDPSVVIPDSSDKNYYDFTQQIRFTQTPVAHADEAFINFIRTETGKIKPLAESDLDSFLSDGKILLNIGKPFHFEGIGYLQKSREGIYEFTPGDSTLPRPAHVPVAENIEENPRSKSFYSDNNAQTGNSRKILLGLGAAAGIILVIWLGYTLYNRSSQSTPLAEAGTANSASADTSAGNALLDSVQSKIDSARAAATIRTSGTGSYRFVIEKTMNKARAYRRFNQIKETLTDIRMESKDSTLFKLYFIIPAQATDTTRIKDSLKIWYGRRQVWVE